MTTLAPVGPEPSSAAPTMYEEYYGFVQSPFTLTPDPRFFYASDPHEKAIKRLVH